MLNNKRCTKCGKEKPLSDFRRDKNRKSGYRGECLNCGRKLWQHWYENLTLEQKEKIRTKAKKTTKNRRKKYAEHYSHKNKIDRLKRYSLTLEMYDKLLDYQKGVCAICGKPETMVNRYGFIDCLSVDHDHVTNKVRGLLCRCCNRAIGSFNDDAELLLRAVSYLTQKSK